MKILASSLFLLILINSCSSYEQKTSSGIQSQPDFQPYCKLDPMFQNYTIFTEEGEQSYFWLPQSEGLNLTFTVSPSDYATITQGATLINSQVDFKDDHDIIQTTELLDTQGQGQFSILVKKSNNYFVYSASGSVNTLPDYTSPLSRSINLTYSSQFNCFDLVQLPGNIVLVDCQTVIAPITDFMFQITDSSFKTIVIHNSPNLGIVTKRKTLLHENDQGVQYVLLAALLDQAEYEDNGYMVILDMNLTQVFSVTPDALNMGNKTLTISDITVYNSTIFLLDILQGIYTFQFDGKNITSLYHVNLQIFQVDLALGITVKQDSGYINIIILDSDNLNVFETQSITNMYLYRKEKYSLGIQLNATQEIQASTTHYAVLIGTTLNVYYTGQTSSPRHIIPDVEYFNLFYSQNLVIYTSNRAYLYTLVHPTLNMDFTKIPIQKSQQLNLTAISQYYDKNISCTYIINSTCLKAQTQNIQDTGIKENLNDTIFNFNESAILLTLGDKYIGPNLKYALIPDSLSGLNLYLDIPQVVKKIHKKNKDLSGTWTLNELLYGGQYYGENIFFMVHQDQKFNMLIYGCMIDHNDYTTIDCPDKYYSSLQLNSQITSFTYWIQYGFFPNLLVVTADQPNIVKEYTETGYLLYQHDFKQPIKQITVQNDLIIAISQDNLSVLVLNMLNNRVMYIFDKSYVQGWKLLGGDWSPKEVHTSHFHRDTIFVRTNSQVVIIELTNHPKLMSVVADDSSKSIALGFVTFGSLVVITDDGISEYSLQQIGSGQTQPKISNYYLYNKYKILNPITAKASWSNLLYVLAQDEKELYVLVFKVNNPQIKTLYQSIPLGITAVDVSKPLFLTTTGENEFTDYVYLVINGQSFLIRSPDQPQVLLLPGSQFPIYTYTYTEQVNVNITSMVDKDEANATREVILVDRQMDVELNQLAIDESGIYNLQLTNFVNEEYPQIWNVPVKDWFYGPVLKLEATCNDCGPTNKIEFINRVHDSYHQPPNMPYNVQDAYYNQTVKKSYILSNNTVCIYDQNFTILQNISLQIPYPSETQCEYLDTDDIKFLYVLCKQIQSNFVQVIQMNGTGSILMKIYNLSQIQIMGQQQIIDGKLLVVNLDYLQSSIFVYDIQNDVANNITNPVPLTVYNSYTLTGDYIDIFSFDVAETDNSEVRKLFVTNYTTTVYTCQIWRSNYTFLEDLSNPSKKAIYPVNIVELVLQRNCYITPETSFINIQLGNFYAQVNQDRTVTLQYSLIIVTDNTAIFEIRFDFDSNSDTKPKPLVYTKILYAFQNYGDQMPLQRIDNFENYFSISYITDQQTIVYVIYYRNVGTGIQRTFDVQMNQIIGGIEIPFTPSITHPIFFFYNDWSGKTKYFVTGQDETTPSKVCSLNPDVAYIYVNNTNFQSQDIILKPISKFVTGDLSIVGRIDNIFEPSVFQPRCEVQQELQNIKIYTEIGETDVFHITAFSGFNLTFDVDNKDTGFFSITQGVQLIKSDASYIPNVVSSAEYLDTAGQGRFAILSKGTDDYSVYSSQGSIFDIPLFNDTKIHLDYTDDYICFDIVVLPGDISIVDCQTRKLPIKDLLFIILPTNPAQIYTDTFDTVVDAANITERNCQVLYTDNDNIIYLISASRSDVVGQNSIMNIYLIDYGVQFKQNSKVATLTYKSFNAQSLVISDYSILEQTIYLLDRTNGIYSFNFDGKDPINIQHYSLSSVWGDIPQAFGIATNYDNGILHIAVANYTNIISFNIDGQRLNVVDIYALGVVVNQTTILTSTSKFLAAQVGTDLIIFKRFGTDFFNVKTDNIKTVIQETQYFQLFYSDNLILYAGGHVKNYALVQPTLNIDYTKSVPSTKQINVTITANSTYGKQSYSQLLTISSIFIYKADTQVYDTGIIENPPNSAYAYSQSDIIMRLGNTYVGPNLSYKEIQGIQTPTSTPTLGEDIKIITDLDIPQKVFYLNNDTVGTWKQNVFLFANQNTFYTVNQDDKNKLIIIECDIDYLDYSKIDCPDSQYFTVQLPGRVVAATQQISKYSTNYIILVTDDNPNIANFYSTRGQFVYKIDLKYHITSLSVQNQFLFAVKDKDFIIVYDLLTNTTLYKIDQSYVKNWNLVEEWSPIKTITDHWHNNTLFVQTLFQVVIIQLNPEPRFLSAVKTDSDAQVHISLTHLIVSNDKIVEYSLQQMGTGSILPVGQTYALYDYTLVKSFGSSTSNGMLYCIGQSDQDYKLMIFRTGSPSLMTLYQVISLNITSFDPFAAISLSANGDRSTGIDYVQIIVDQELIVVRSPSQPRVILKSVQGFPTYLYNFYRDVSVNIKSMDGTTAFNQTRRVILINKQEQVLINQQAIDNSHINKIEYSELASRTQPKSFSFNVTDWFFGPVTHLHLDCSDCGKGKKVEIHNRVHEIEDQPPNMPTNVRDAFFDEKTKKSFVLSGSQVLIYDHGFQNLLTTINLQEVGNTTCIHIESEDVTQYLYVLCEYENWFVQVIDMTGPTPSIRMKSYNLNNVKLPKERQVMNKRLLVLSMDNNNGAIFVYDIGNDIDNGIDTPTPLITYSVQTLDPNKTLFLQLTSFQMYKTSISYINKLFISNQTKVMYSLEVNVEDYSVKSVSPINIEQMIMQRNAYITDDTRLLTIKIVNYSETIQNKTISEIYSVVLLTSNTATYELSLVFNKQIPQIQLCFVKFAFQNYGWMKPLERIESFGNYFSISYYMIGGSTYSQVVYYREEKPQFSQILLDQIIGGIEILIRSGPLQARPSYFFFPSQTGEIMYFSNPLNDTPSKIYSLNPEMITINFYSNDISKQKFQIIPVSYYAKDIVPLEGEFNSDFNPEKEKSYTWIIILSVIAGVLILAGLAFFFYKKNQATKQALLDEENGMSMQEPLKAE